MARLGNRPREQQGTPASRTRAQGPRSEEETAEARRVEFDTASATAEAPRDDGETAENRRYVIVRAPDDDENETIHFPGDRRFAETSIAFGALPTVAEAEGGSNKV